MLYGNCTTRDNLDCFTRLAGRKHVRQAIGALLLISQYPVDTWHERIADPTVADAMLDRLLNNAYTIELKGDSLRIKKPEKEDTANDPA